MRTVIMGLLLAVLYSCTSNAPEPVAPQPEPTPPVEAEVPQPAPPSPYQITEQGFYGIEVGQAISAIETKIEASVLQTGEGDFDVYDIFDEDGTALGNFFPNLDDPTLVGNIEVTTPKAQTAEGFKVGTTYAEIQEQLTDYEVHGSEIEGQTHVYYNNFALRLDHQSADYELDKAAIPATAKVLYIVVLVR